MTIPFLLLFLFRRLASVTISSVIVTAVLNALALLTPEESGAELSMPDSQARLVGLCARHVGPDAIRDRLEPLR